MSHETAPRTSETFTEGLRRRLGEFSACPTCHRPINDGGTRKLAEQVGVNHTTLWRFLRGGDMNGRGIDKVVSFLDGIGR